MKETIDSTIDLALSPNNYPRFYASSPDMYLCIDPTDASIKECNDAVLHKTGYSKNEIIGQTIFFMYHPDSLLKVEKAFHDFTVKGRVVNAELDVRCKNGNKIPVLLNAEAVRSAEGTILYSNSCWRDISEVKYLENQLAKVNQELALKVFEIKRKDKELEQFVNLTNHKFQEPVEAITNYSNLLINEYDDVLDSFASKSVTAIYDASVHMKKLIRGLLDYNRIGLKSKLSEMDCNQVVDSLRIDLSDDIYRSSATILAANLPSVLGYQPEIKSLLKHLISNAIKFHKKGVPPIIQIKSISKSDHWLFEVADNGIGVAQTNLSSIFKIFQRAHSSNEYSGTGIGLAQCYKIVELHRGKIWAESTLGEGSCFYFTLPKLMS